jgi:uncharacterized protein (TIGR02246 family)
MTAIADEMIAKLTTNPAHQVAPEALRGIIAHVSRLAAAWIANDADTLSTLYAEDASVILPEDTFLQGREAIRVWMAEAFATKWKGTHCLGQPLELKQLSDDIVVMFSQGGAYQPGDEWVVGQNAIRGMWVFLRDGDGWTIKCYSNTRVLGHFLIPEGAPGGR